MAARERPAQALSLLDGKDGRMLDRRRRDAKLGQPGRWVELDRRYDCLRAYQISSYVSGSAAAAST